MSKKKEMIEGKRNSVADDRSRRMLAGDATVRVVNGGFGGFRKGMSPRYVSRDCRARDSSVSYIWTAEPETLLTLTLSSFIFTILGRKKLFLSFLFDMAPRGRSRTPGRSRSGDQPAAAPEANLQDPEGLYRLNDEWHIADDLVSYPTQ
ncbi:hypothetical protein PIB30_095102 [Stylosanthes scabra]|uniref:Uncharacterized protein n=1 Tax=Stylosanthes scabra TaxID=79078 RepID=A0ABU6XT88_9FABA|nr:hypothetical protein [Stylosanthes scabra]